ncbi:MAG: N-acetylmuramoyl-L-alanine amidase [Bdellovibrio sp.]|nr:N-acetylmuramoyl-L-alanine amidase [Bdellovibrio sp.]
MSAFSILRIYLIAFLLFAFSPAVSRAFNLVIDPGHGGSDKGTFRGSFVESEIVLKIAQKLKADLEERAPAINIFVTRDRQSFIPLKDRVQIAHEKNADLFLSLHANSSTSAQVSGMEYYFSAQKNAPVFLKSKNAETAQTQQAIVAAIQNDLIEFGKTKQSLDFSKKIQSVWTSSEFGQKQSRTSKIRRAPFYVIENTQMPSVLVEVGFISNQREAKKLVTEVYQNELAHALSEAVLTFAGDFKEKSDK